MTQTPKVNSSNEYNHATHGKSTKEDASQKWLMFSKFLLCCNKAQEDPDDINKIQMNHVFANCSEEDEIYPLTVKKIVEAQKADAKLKHFFKCNATPEKRTRTSTY